jgi:hypothetical protein
VSFHKEGASKTIGRTNKTTFEKYTWVLHKRQVKQEIQEISLVLRHTKDFCGKN